jgi:hypothetical protein
MSFAELDELWDAAKAEARAEAGGHLTAANKESAE